MTSELAAASMIFIAMKIEFITEVSFKGNKSWLVSVVVTEVVFCFCFFSYLFYFLLL